MARREEAAQEHVFGLIDTESGNMVGSFRSEPEALRAVADTARQYGEASDAVLSLSLFRWDVPPEEGFIADGAELVRRAMAPAGIPATGTGASAGPNGARGSNSRDRSPVSENGKRQPA